MARWRHNPWLRLAPVCLRAAGAAVALAAISWILAARFFGLQLLAVQTGSMRPVFAPGDALIMRRTSYAAIRPGTIVSYHSSLDQRELVTHRVIALNRQTHTFMTQGDALHRADPKVDAAQLVGRVVTILPGGGRPLDWLRSKVGLVVCVYIPMACIVLGELGRLARHFAYRSPYRLYRGVV